MMDTIDSHYAVKMEELIFTKYPKNKFIDGNMAYVVDDNKNTISYEVEMLLKVELPPHGTKRKKVMCRLSQQSHHYLTC